MQLINVVNENETKWTHFRLIIHPAQVKRSGVYESVCAGSKPVGLPLLINTSEDGRYSKFQRMWKRLRQEGRGLERSVTRNAR